MNVVTRKLDLDQTSVVHKHTERNECDKTRGHVVILFFVLFFFSYCFCLFVCLFVSSHSFLLLFIVHISLVRLSNLFVFVFILFLLFNIFPMLPKLFFFSFFGGVGGGGVGVGGTKMTIAAYFVEILAIDLEK